ncbi:MAG: alpha/beta hydrolase [Rhizobiaceae bacterium]
MSTWHQNETGGLTWRERPGTGDTLVLLHGIGSNAISFAGLLPHLGSLARVIAWNAPGYGGSTPLDTYWPQASDYADALLRLFDAAGINQAVLVGHSLGCLMAGAFTAAHHDRVARLVMASPALGHGVPRGEQLSVAAQTRIDELERLGPEAFADLRAARLVYQPEENPQTLAIVRRSMAQVSLPGYAQAARMLASGRLLDDAERISVPTDVIVGSEDVVTPPDGAARLHQTLHAPARGKLVQVPGVGHALYQQCPSEFAKALELEPELAG